MNPDVVHEEQGFGPLDDQIVDVHGHAILPNRVVHPQLRSQHHLGAHTVGAAYQHRIAVVSLEEPLVVIEAEHPRERPVLAKNAGTVGAA
mgnify:CR=1 FL=1